MTRRSEKPPVFEFIESLVDEQRNPLAFCEAEALMAALARIKDTNERDWNREGLERARPVVVAMYEYRFLRTHLVDELARLNPGPFAKGLERFFLEIWEEVFGEAELPDIPRAYWESRRQYVAYVFLAIMAVRRSLEERSHKGRSFVFLAQWNLRSAASGSN